MAFEWGTLIGPLFRLFGWLAKPFERWKTKGRTRKKLYTEAAGIYRLLVSRIWNIEQTPALEEGFTGQWDTLVKAEYYRHVRSNIELYTEFDQDEQAILDGLYDAFLVIPTHKAHQRYFYARLAVVFFEDRFLQGKLQQKLVLECARPPVKSYLEMIRRGDRDSAIDSTKHPGLDP